MPWLYTIRSRIDITIADGKTDEAANIILKCAATVLAGDSHDCYIANGLCSTHLDKETSRDENAAKRLKSAKEKSRMMGKIIEGECCCLANELDA